MLNENKSEISLRIRRTDSAGLLTEWAKLQTTEMSNHNKGLILELMICRAFELEGATVKYPYDVKVQNMNSEQIDGAVYFDHIACLIECKNEADPINFEPISKLRSQLQRRPSGTIGAIFTTSGFTEPAIILAQYTSPQTILLWERKEIEQCLNQKSFKSGLLKKYNYCIEMGLSNYSLIEA
ncbi:restriction endonuclease [Mucilaginibacter paludis]|uniref:Restriction endonuclease type IV Mrr domain-containing protein n=1 Tax=Mucilaginibacter paludis DSM 18603 TaxID=714943 RepID=H1Y7T0_9SPHI|nr:restriction endonuclease [Mucilaginibacter paludis]EHQ29925.1 hypothetical protein Mucpa_5859 [Mucilaginibacter paludis DSM 18603]